VQLRQSIEVTMKRRACRAKAFSMMFGKTVKQSELN
jgi:hypothetical protein